MSDRRRSDKTVRSAHWLREKLPQLLALVVLITTVVLSLIAGCIRRVPAPTDDAPAPAPYSAVVAWLEIELPQAPKSVGQPPAVLPEIAIRLAFGSSDRIWADTALMDGRDQAQVAEDWGSVVRLLRSRTERDEAIVALGYREQLCSLDEDIRTRILLASTASTKQQIGHDERLGDEALEAVPLTKFCRRSDRDQSSTSLVIEPKP